MSKTIRLDEGNLKMNAFLSDLKHPNLAEVKTPIIRTKYSSFAMARKQKPRPKSIYFERERLYDENIQLKQMSNTLLEENIKLKTRLQQNEKDFKKYSEKSPERSIKGTSLVGSLKNKVKEQNEQLDKLQAEYQDLKITIRATRVAELEEEAKQYFNECWRLKKLLEEIEKTNKLQKQPINEDIGSLLEKIREQNQYIQSLIAENKAQKALIDAKNQEIKELKEKIDNIKPNLKKVPKFQEEKQNSPKAKQPDTKKTIKSPQKSEDLSPKKISEKSDNDQSKKTPQKTFGKTLTLNHDKTPTNNIIKSVESAEHTPVITINKGVSQDFSISQNKETSLDSNEFSKNIQFSRELAASNQVILDNFFRKLYNLFSNKNISLKDFLHIIDPENKQSLNLDELILALQANGYKFPKNEIEAVYKILTSKYNTPTISLDNISIQLQLHETDSNNSYDISSESSYGNDFIGEDLALVKIPGVIKDDINKEFDILHVSLVFQGFDIEKFRKYLEEKLPETVELSSLAKLFLEKYTRIEDGVERNKICSFIMENRETAEKNYVIRKIVELVYVDEAEESVKKEKFSQIWKKVQENKDIFLEKCQAQDSKDRELLSWKDIEEILLEIGIDKDPVAFQELKVKCYSFERSLNIIPYKDLIDL
ncbi:hypothetical protein SteCoe_29337 [Stentor coeruleus]|uniref:EF-hand domain-containing protein n=1 Tax=Stentor coeruleus TaxID=5963 RepID=A0A1R2B660_9CILI|nr:hypothetical protein SteCoe_29337 [Stentor coeruleus]